MIRVGFPEGEGRGGAGRRGGEEREFRSKQIFSGNKIIVSSRKEVSFGLSLDMFVELYFSRIEDSSMVLESKGQ